MEDQHNQHQQQLESQKSVSEMDSEDESIASDFSDNSAKRKFTPLKPGGTKKQKAIKESANDHHVDTITDKVSRMSADSRPSSSLSDKCENMINQISDLLGDDPEVEKGIEKIVEEKDFQIKHLQEQVTKMSAAIFALKSANNPACPPQPPIQPSTSTTSLNIQSKPPGKEDIKTNNNSTSFAKKLTEVKRNSFEEALELFNNPSFIEDDGTILLIYVPENYPNVVFTDEQKGRFSASMTSIGNKCINQNKANSSDVQYHHEAIQFVSGTAFHKATNVASAIWNGLEVEAKNWSQILGFKVKCSPAKNVELAPTYIIEIPNTEDSFHQASETIENTNNIDTKSWRVSVVFRLKPQQTTKKFLFVTKDSLDHVIPHGTIELAYGTSNRFAKLRKVKKLSSNSSNSETDDDAGFQLHGRKRKLLFNEICDAIAKKSQR